MAVEAKLLNGTNLTRDAGFMAMNSYILTDGVRSNLDSDLEVVPGFVQPGMAFINVLRTAVIPNETFLIPVRVTTPEVVDTATDGFIIIEVDQAKINDGSSNNQDGTDIAMVKNVPALPVNNYILLAQISGGMIIDARVSSSLLLPSGDFNSIKVDNINSLSGDTVNIEGVLIKDGEIDLEELPGAPATPTANRWKLYFKSDGVYIIDDAGVEQKIQTGAVTPSIELQVGEAVNAGDALRINPLTADGKAYKTSDVKDVALEDSLGQTINVTVDEDWNQLDNAIHRVDTDKWLFVWRYYDSGTNTHIIRAKVGEITDGLFNFGSQVSVVSATPIDSMQFTAKRGVEIVDSGIVYFTWAENDNTSVVYSRRATIAGTVITLGTETVVRTVISLNEWGPPRVAALQKTGTDHVLIGYRQENGNLQVQAVQDTTVGGISTVLSSDGVSNFDIVYNEEQKATILYENNGDNNFDARVITQTVNTTTIALGAVQDDVITPTNGTNIQLEQESTDEMYCLYGDSATPFLLQFVAVDRAGDVITADTPVTIATGKPSSVFSEKEGNIAGRMQKFNNGLYGVVHNATIRPSSRLLFAGQAFDVGGFTQTNAQRYIQVSFVDVTGADPVVIPLNKMIFGDQGFADIYYEETEEDTPYVVALDPSIRSDDNTKRHVVSKIDINNFVGWADSSGVMDDNIVINPIKDDNQTGLVPGAIYNLGDNGTLELNGSGKAVAQAITATEVVRVYDNDDLF